ncbi:GTP-binding protein [Candidatus Woesearchaeota archaeon]|nr:GTP-binding protein [Candidatus Woesearchaeota archaeon]
MAFEKDHSKIKELEERIAKTKYNKSTQHAIGQYKAQIAALKDKLEKRKASSGGQKSGYSVKRSGDGTVIMVGYPSTGKSTLLNALTDAKSEVAAYAFTTLTVIPGMLAYKHAKIQILDVPGIVHGAASGRGRGKEVLSTMRNADMCMIILESMHPNHLKSILKEINETGIRLNKKKPDVKIRKTAKDGIRIGRTVKTPDLNDATVKSILQTFRINNADVLIRSVINADEFIDCIQENKKYMNAIIVLNKEDVVTKERLVGLKKRLGFDISVSGEEETHLDELKDLIYDKLELISVFLKEPAKPADLEEPLVMFRDCTIKDVCEKLHRDFVDKFKFSRVWGKSAKFGGQKLALTHTLKDDDVLELHIR